MDSVTYERHIVLKDGRKLGYSEYGDLNGKPIMVLHGTPGSRLYCLEDEPVAESLGVRLITPERPGYGISDFRSYATMLEWADDVAELADCLGLEKFVVLGGSGGGAYVLACAYKLPERIEKAGIACSMAPLVDQSLLKNMAYGNRIGFSLVNRFPRLNRYLVKNTMQLFLKNPRKYFHSMLRQLCESDKKIILAILLDEKKLNEVTILMSESYRQGIEGAVQDMALVVKDWGFALSDIKVPVYLWHGEEDTLVPVAMGRYLAEHIPTCQAFFLPNTGHFLTDDPMIWNDILRTLKA